MTVVLGVRSWSLWSVNRLAKCFLLGVELVALTLLVWCLLTQSVTADAFVRLGVVVLLSGVYSTLGARVERIGRLLHNDKVLWANQKSVWVVAALLVVPAGLAGLLVVVLFGQTLLRSLRDKALRPYRTVYTTAASVLGALAAGLTYQALGSYPYSNPLKALTVLAMLVVFTFTSLLLVIAGAYFAGRPPRLRMVFPTPSALLDEFAALIVGVVAGIIVLRAPWLAPTILVLVAALHRSALARHLQVATLTDARTGLLTLSAWRHKAEGVLRDAANSATPAAVMMIDLDHFKRINDTYGHLLGDQVLKTVADLLSRELRSGDLLGRFGGEEFVALLPNTDERAGQQIAERMRRCLHTITISTAPTLHVSASIGIALYPDHGRTLNDVLHNADLAVYDAKHSGRDTTTTAHPHLP